jgi:diguanylate cyclase (GGDEF)-like protein
VQLKQDPFKEILVVEDTQFFTNLIRRKIRSASDLTVHCVTTMAAAKAHLADRDQREILCLSDMNLPDAPTGEMVEYLTDIDVPTIVFSGTYDEKIRDRIINLGAIDYITKESPSSLDYLVSVINRVTRNRQLVAMVVDDSKTGRKYLSSLLRRFQLNVLTAENGEDAINKMTLASDIRLIITDFAMPKMDGFELIKEIRKEWPKEQLAIIGLSGSETSGLSAKFIKIGADDFIGKNFEVEELFCRIQQNLDNLDRLHSLHNAATTDYLTGLYNRRYFFDMAANMVAAGNRRDSPPVLAMIDIDKFKAVNDTYGHDTGDDVLVKFSDLLKKTIRASDLAARLGGEEFCILLADAEPETLPRFFRRLMEVISTMEVNIADQVVKISASIGVCFVTGDAKQAITVADKLLYEAKESGRNQTIINLDGDKKAITVPGPEGFDYG